MADPRSTPRLQGVPRKLSHLLLVVLGWVGFVWMWVLVARQPWESERLVWLVLGSLLILPLLTFAWIRHNRSLHRRKGERRAVTVASPTYDRDWHGRVVEADWSRLLGERCIVISVNGQRKLYRGGPLPRTGSPEDHAPPAPAPTLARAPAPAPVAQTLALSALPKR